MGSITFVPAFLKAHRIKKRPRIFVQDLAKSRCHQGYDLLDGDERRWRSTSAMYLYRGIQFVTPPTPFTHLTQFNFRWFYSPHSWCGLSVPKNTERCERVALIRTLSCLFSIVSITGISSGIRLPPSHSSSILLVVSPIRVAGLMVPSALEVLIRRVSVSKGWTWVKRWIVQERNNARAGKRKSLILVFKGLGSEGGYVRVQQDW